MDDYRIPERAGIGWVELRVADLQRALDFYQDVVGLRPTELPGTPAGPSGQPGVALAVDRDAPPLVFLIADPQAHRRPPHTTGLYHTAIRFPSRAALGQALRRLLTQGYPLGGMADHGVSEALYLRDPDQNGVELYWDRPHEQWPRSPDGRVTMFTRALDLNSLLAELSSLN